MRSIGSPLRARQAPMAPITARECNEFLRSLPPLALYGEPGCPFNPPRMEANNG